MHGVPAAVAAEWEVYPDSDSSEGSEAGALMAPAAPPLDLPEDDVFPEMPPLEEGPELIYHFPLQADRYNPEPDRADPPPVFVPVPQLMPVVPGVPGVGTASYAVPIAVGIIFFLVASQL
jgi:hypothetical protein